MKQIAFTKTACTSHFRDLVTPMPARHKRHEIGDIVFPAIAFDTAAESGSAQRLKQKFLTQRC